MKYNAYPRLMFTAKKGASRRKRRRMQRLFDHFYFHVIDHALLEKQALDSLIYGTGRLHIGWDEAAGESVTRHIPHV